MTIVYHPLTTPKGLIHIAADDNRLLAVSYGSRNWQKLQSGLGEIRQQENTITRKTRRQLQEYLEGSRKVFELPLGFDGTPFQNRAWKALLTIPYGETRSYSEQAAIMGTPKAVRAVGTANGRNPIGIIIPCHRVIGKAGNLSGYAGGVAIKQFLLQLEASHHPDHTLRCQDPE